MADPDFTWTSVLVDISGADPRVADQIQRNALIGAEDLTVIPATEILGESTRTLCALPDGLQLAGPDRSTAARTVGKLTPSASRASPWARAR